MSNKESDCIETSLSKEALNGAGENSSDATENNEKEIIRKRGRRPKSLAEYVNA